MPSFEIRHAEDSVWASVAPGICVRDLRLAELTDGAWTLQLGGGGGASPMAGRDARHARHGLQS
ncbi:MAG: hypothetical protein IPM80_05225 [Proteobacteria bacterium]|nr:hypothetical protein [Pseudomonadota bacterium]